MEEQGTFALKIGYLGDDLNDYVSMFIYVFKVCPLNGCKEIKVISDYISVFEGRNSAVRNIVEYALKER